MDITYYTTVKDAWESVFQDITNAQDSIYFEQYIISDLHEGQIGRELIDLLIQKSKKGVRVELLVDIFGSRNLLAYSVYQKIKESGIRISFTDIKYVNFIKHLPWETKRNHRKLVVIDNKITHIGGVVYMEEVRYWNDFQARIEGEIYRTEKAFTFSKDDAETELSKKEKRGKKYELLMNDFNKKNITEEIYKKIKSAKKEVIIFTPYFSCSVLMIKLLKEKSKSGVSVHIYVPQKPDNILAHITHHYMTRVFRKTNVQFMTNEGPMNHAKVIRVDDWITFGSCNFDYLSFYYNKELNIATGVHSEVKNVMRLLSRDYMDYPQTFYNAIYKQAGFFKRNLYVYAGFFTRFFS